MNHDLDAINFMVMITKSIRGESLTSLQIVIEDSEKMYDEHANFIQTTLGKVATTDEEKNQHLEEATKIAWEKELVPMIADAISRKGKQNGQK